MATHFCKAVLPVCLKPLVDTLCSRICLHMSAALCSAAGEILSLVHLLTVSVCPPVEEPWLAAALYRTDGAGVPLTVSVCPPVEKPWLAASLYRTDGAGVPRTVLLSERTLRDGVCGLRSRDTTLNHQVHVSQLTEVR